MSARNVSLQRAGIVDRWQRTCLREGLGPRCRLFSTKRTVRVPDSVQGVIPCAGALGRPSAQLGRARPRTVRGRVLRSAMYSMLKERVGNAA